MISHLLSYSHSSDDNQKSLQCNVYFVWQIIHLRTPVSILIVPQAGWTQFTMQIRPSCGKSNFKEGKKKKGRQHKASWIFFFLPGTLQLLEGCQTGSLRNETLSAHSRYCVLTETGQEPAVLILSPTPCFKGRKDELRQKYFIFKCHFTILNLYIRLWSS